MGNEKLDPGTVEKNAQGRGGKVSEVPEDLTTALIQATTEENEPHSNCSCSQSCENCACNVGDEPTE